MVGKKQKDTRKNKQQTIYPHTVQKKCFLIKQGVSKIKVNINLKQSLLNMTCRYML